MATKTLQFTINSINLTTNDQHPLIVKPEDRYKLVFFMSHPRAGKANIVTVKDFPLELNEEFTNCNDKIIFKEKVEVKSCVEISIQLLLVNNKSKFENFLSEVLGILIKPIFSSITAGISNVVVNKLVEQPLNTIIDNIASKGNTIKIADKVIGISEGIRNIDLNLIEVISTMPEADLEKFYLDDENGKCNNLADAPEKQKYLESATLNYEIKYF